MRYFRSKTLIVTVLVLAFVFGGALTVGGIVRGTQDFTLKCTGFESNGGRLLFNRDNTGEGRERFTIIATDGMGNLLYGPVTQTMVVGSSLEYPSGLFEAWQAPPQANPLFMSITSEGGNGLVKETIYRRTDRCANLSRTSNAVLESSTISNILPADGQTSPPMELNEAPYTPISINDLADLLGLSGYGIVNTSRLNMRSGDGIQYRRVAILNGGTEMVILGRNEDASWWYVQVDEARGWVNADFIILRGDLRQAGLVPAQGEIAKPRFIFYRDYPVYNGPNVTADVVCTLAGNLEYNVVGRSADWNWYQVQVMCDGIPLTAWAEASLGALRREGQPIAITE